MTDSPSAPLKFSARNLKESVGSLFSHVRSMANMINQRTTCELGITRTQGGILFMMWSEKCLLAAELAREFRDRRERCHTPRQPAWSARPAQAGAQRRKTAPHAARVDA